MEKRQLNRKEVILSTAKELFAQKGFDGTSMDELATQTNVPKSLIYYHFKSKQGLLNAIIERFFADYEYLLGSIYSDNKKKVMDILFDFLYVNKDFLRIIVVESMKKDKNVSTFNIVKILLQYESETKDNKDLLDYNKSHYRWVTEFFMNIVPCALFACLVDDWSAYFNTNSDSVKNDFFAVYQKILVGFHDEFNKDM